jgi:hypothetical protein
MVLNPIFPDRVDGLKASAKLATAFPSKTLRSDGGLLKSGAAAEK